MNKEFWDSKYSDKDYIYGENANNYLIEKLKDIQVGKVLLPADGEGRNSVYCALQNWETYCFDMSKEGKVKAESLAKKNNVNINYQVGFAQDINYEIDFFDALVLIFAHFPASIKFDCNKKFANSVKIGGFVIFEAFSKKQIEYQKTSNSGGPGDINMLYSVEEIKESFPNFEIIELKEEDVLLKEGKFHDGLGSVIRFFGKKIK